MKKNLDKLVDRGCWISDDRVYAFISADGNISELGYHGTQPVSRNSRILVHAGGVVSFAYIRPDGTERSIDFREVHWEAGQIDKSIPLSVGSLDLRIRACGRSVTIDWSGAVSETTRLVVRVSRNSEYSEVQGVRTWQEPLVDDGVTLQCRDQIMLQSWLVRSGPYAGDFLIPEPIRRRIFSGRKRSGMATRDDLRPEFKEKDITLYDAAVLVRFSGERFSLTSDREQWIFQGTITPDESRATFQISFGDMREDASLSDRREEAERNDSYAPSLKLGGFPAWEEFFTTVPALVRSCCIRDLGVPRATPGRYYWIWAWDMLVTVYEAMRWGDVKLCRDTIRFVNEHRDDNGQIPARWTRSLLPLDTPSPGGIEFLLAALTHLVVHETGDSSILKQVFPALVAPFRSVAPSLIQEGFVRGEGFYPDLPGSFGRTGKSAVAMETGSWYSYCAILKDLATLVGDRAVAQEARQCMGSIARIFPQHFDHDRFLLDAVDPSTGKGNGKHPLFSLLFLHASPGFDLMRHRIDEIAETIERRFLTTHGMRMMPVEEGKGEVVLDSWYPHWDVYALKILRRAGRGEAIMQWLRLCEEVLTKLGYCPEFLGLSGFRSGDPLAWAHHGAASNLNCVTGWYRAIREAVFGIEIDGNSMTHIPLALPLGRIVLEGLRWRGGTWTITVDYSGPDLKSVVVDDEEMAGLVIPGSYGTPGAHQVVIRYGDEKRIGGATNIGQTSLLTSYAIAIQSPSL